MDDEKSFVVTETENAADFPVGTIIPTKLFEYDAAGRLTTVALPAVAEPDTSAVVRPRYEYGYDAQGRQTTIRDNLAQLADGTVQSDHDGTAGDDTRQTLFTYDAQGRQLARTLPLGVSSFNPHATGVGVLDSNGRIPTGFTPDPFTEYFWYNDRGQQLLHVSFEGVVTQFAYDNPVGTDFGTGRLAEKWFFDNLAQYQADSDNPAEVWTYNYDAFGREATVVRALRDRTSETVVHTDTVTTAYDAEGRITRVSSPEGIITYAYDDLGRKTYTIVHPFGADPDSDTPERVTAYTYDALGRLATVVEDLDPSSTADTPLSARYEYDLPGKLARTDLPNGAVTTYQYDRVNRLDVMTQYGPDGSVPAGQRDADLSGNPKTAEFDYTVRADGKRTGAAETFWFDTDSDPETPAEAKVNTIAWAMKRGQDSFSETSPDPFLRSTDQRSAGPRPGAAGQRFGRGPRAAGSGV